MSIIDSIIWHPLTTECFIQSPLYKKETIFLHHTAGNGSAIESIGWWQHEKNRVSVPFVISRGTTIEKEGAIYQTYNSRYSGFHLGLSASDMVKGGKMSNQMNFNAIGIELSNWGYLVHNKQGQFVTYDGTIINETEVIELDTPFRGYQYYQSYTPAQLDSLKQLLEYLSTTYEISLSNTGIGMFDISKEAFTIIPEHKLWTHVSVRKTGKYDMSPQPELISMLESL